MERNKRREKLELKMDKKNSKKIYLIYSLTFAICLALWITIGVEFRILPTVISLVWGVLLGLFICFVVRMAINKKEEMKKTFGINITLNEIEILICIISLFSFDIIFESLGNPYLFDFLGMVVGIFVGWLIVRLIRKLKSK